MLSQLLYPLLVVSTVSIVPLSEAPSDSETRKKDNWTQNALKKLWEHRKEMGQTPLFKYKYPSHPNVEIIFKNESAAETGSLKHRYAWMLLAWAIREGHITRETNGVYEASSGNTAASLCKLTKMIGHNFTAIVPSSIERIKQDHIEGFGGRVIKVDISERLVRAEKEAQENGGFFMNQFGNADKAEDFHESGDFDMESVNMFHEIVHQLRMDPTQLVKVPHYMVHSAGTGGTITSIGRYIKKYALETQVVLADSQFSIYYDYVMYDRFTNTSGAEFWKAPGMAGIGFGPMGAAIKGKTTSLDPAVIDRALKIPDVASTAAMQVLREQGINGGPSSGVNFLAALHIAASHKQPSLVPITIVTILADSGDNYESSYYNRTWIEDQFEPLGGLKAYDCWIWIINRSLEVKIDPLTEGHKLCDQI